MTKYILNAFPNSFMPTPTQKILLTGIAEKSAKEWAAKGEIVSAIGHESTAHLFSARLGIGLKMNRIQVNFSPDDEYLIGAFQLPRRLNEGELLTEQEILALPIRWVIVTEAPPF